jgi:hypothetical protein
MPDKCRNKKNGQTKNEMGEEAVGVREVDG